MKVLITGGCGFIGVNLVKFLSERGFTIRIIDNLSVGKKEYLETLSVSEPPECIIQDCIRPVNRSSEEVSEEASEEGI